MASHVSLTPLHGLNSQHAMQGTAIEGLPILDSFLHYTTAVTTGVPAILLKDFPSQAIFKLQSPSSLDQGPQSI